MNEQLGYYLISISALDGGSMHAYLVTKDADHILKAASKMADLFDEQKIPYLPMILSTPVRDEKDQIETLLRQLYPETKAVLDEIKDFHLTVWQMANGKDNDKMLAMH